MLCSNPDIALGFDRKDVVCSQTSNDNKKKQQLDYCFGTFIVYFLLLFVLGGQIPETLSSLKYVNEGSQGGKGRTRLYSVARGRGRGDLCVFFWSCWKGREEME